ncbi:MAG: PA14 domain-containing protein, partial [Prochlorococcus sp.]
MGVSKNDATPFWGNGHYYTFTKEGARWDAAKDRSTAVLNGQTGYLATVTSQAENDFIYDRSFNGTPVPNDGFLGGADVYWNGVTLEEPKAYEGQWIWQTGPEQGKVFRSAGSNTMYANWHPGGEPNNQHNQDFLQLYSSSGYWDDVDPDNRGGYITEWGNGGAEYNISFSALNHSNNQNGTEGGKPASMVISLDRDVRSDYKDHRDNKPLIDIPISFDGNAVLGTDYTISVDGRTNAEGKDGGFSYYENGVLYILQTGNKSVTLTFNPKNNETWQPLRTITATMSADGSENIYAFQSAPASSSQVWLFDDEPQLSLGQGAWQYIRAPYTEASTGKLPDSNSGFVIDDDVLIFDENGINETDSSFNALGLYDTFATRWETYLRIPETGSYKFKTTTDDGVKLSVRKNNSSGNELGSYSKWYDQASTTHETEWIEGDDELKEGDVVWLRFDHYENKGAASAKLLWDRPSAANEVVPATAMFLSEELARGTNRTEAIADSFDTGFQVFANKESKKLGIKLTSTSEEGTTYQTNKAQRQAGASFQVGDDYRLEDPNDGEGKPGTNINTGTIGIDDKYGTLSLTPNQGDFSQNEIKTINVAVLTDSYAENTESVTLTLKEASGYGVSNDNDIDEISQTVDIADYPFELSFDPIHQFGQNAKSASMSHDPNIEVSPAGGVPLRMSVNGADPYTHTYNTSNWNISEATPGESWTFSVYAKADRETWGQLFLFEAKEDGSYTSFSAPTIQLGTEWARYSVTRTISDASTKFIQVRLDGPDNAGTIWWDGVQVEKADEKSSFTTDTTTNRFADIFNPLDLYNGTEVVNATEGDWGWVSFNTGGRQAPESGMRVRYSIEAGSAIRDNDYFAPQATLSTESFKPDNYIFLP